MSKVYGDFSFATQIGEIFKIFKIFCVLEWNADETDVTDGRGLFFATQNGIILKILKIFYAFCF